VLVPTQVFRSICVTVLLQKSDNFAKRKIHTVVGLHEFCKINGLAASSLQYSINTQQPIKKGKSKGWRLLAKK
jgi:hypothetical protein